jgi:hypothetical protein
MIDSENTQVATEAALTGTQVAMKAHRRTPNAPLGYQRVLILVKT